MSACVGELLGTLHDILQGLAERTAMTHLALVHGDVSPQNILVGPAGPVLLDAACAWYGDPAFCLNHLPLKSPVLPGRRAELVGSSRALTEARLEPRSALVLLARVDGKSPVEYLTDDQHRQFVRGTAAALLRAAMTFVLSERLIPISDGSW
ncbi:hypothetical protein [Streptomyces sp. NPDC001536]|uniref:hypothetical protein n=1 Tax=Streptomyces sp. NPDC001536 TaxID=3364583 RepID=UPI00369D3356